MDVNFELYKVFYHVSKTLSFSEAASHLYISQSAVSQSIKLLEEKIGCQLFFRNTKKVKPTKEGEVLFTHIEQAYNFIKAGERTLESMNNLTQGEIRIGATDTICKYYLMPYLKKFNELYPQVKIHITNRTSPRCIELLKNGSVDIAVINIPQDLGYKNIDLRPTQLVKDVFIGGMHYSKLNGRKVNLKELETYPLLVLEKGTVTREFFDKMMTENNVKKQPDVELGSVSLLVEMAAINLGIAFVPNVSINKGIEQNELFVLDLEEEVPERYIGIATHSNIPMPVSAIKFIELITAED